MKFTTSTILLAVVSLVAAQGTQFITGPCTSDADCASGCCGFNTGRCAGAIVALERDGGCGFGNAQSNDNAAQLLRGAAPAANVQQDAPAAAPAQSAAVAPGTQFITGECSSDADCASACCGFNSGKCAGPVVAQERDGGCGFGDAQPNDDAAQALQRRNRYITKRQGTQFITGDCSSDADCASGCCGFNTGKCAGAIVALERDGGCGFGDAQSNDNAAQLLRGEQPAVEAASDDAAEVEAAPAQSTAVAPGTQFITGECSSDADCASACCGFNSGKCAGPVIAQERDGGCGFGDAQPNDIAAQALQGRK